MEAKLIAMSLSWIAHLSSYARQVEAPDILFKPHAFFVEITCHGNEKYVTIN